jgi:predicted ABC-type ATPase
VIAGPNGVGKSTAAYGLIPAGIEQLNPDDIARQFREHQTQKEVILQFTNDELQRRIQGHIKNRKSFGVETNLHDAATWQYFLAIQQAGYSFELLFLCASQLDTLVKRVENRYHQGGHFVRENVIRGRYQSGLLLLNHYFDRPDVLTLIDASSELRIIYKRVDGQVVEQIETLPAWITTSLHSHFSTSTSNEPLARDADTIEQVRAMYQQSESTNEQTPPQ